MFYKMKNTTTTTTTSHLLPKLEFKVRDIYIQNDKFIARIFVFF